ncbi:MAG: sulfurtransferase [Bacteroidia bacterium]|nr:sulfurtransferase [Bacteroidia bacterium]
MYKTFISAYELAQHLDNPQWQVFDCRHELKDTEAGRNAYKVGHIPGAIFAHLDEDLSGPIDAPVTGRHPLPHPDKFLESLQNWGLNPDTQVVVYDDKGGGIAARLWWMLKAMGHEAVAVLDGGIQAWEASGGALSTDIPQASKGTIEIQMQEGVAVNVKEVEARSQSGQGLLIDARAGIRYRGEKEPIDPIAGHIPSAVSAPWMENLGEDKKIKSKEDISARFQEILGDTPIEESIVYCGSGVTACHNLLAMEYAGLSGARLYPGSWSHWITDKDRAIEKE